MKFEKRILQGILLFALLLRISFAFYNPPEIADDTHTYVLLADHLIEGKGYTQNGQDPTRVRTPTYPVFLALIRALLGTNPQAILIVQSFLGSLTVYFVFLIAQRIFDTRTGLIAALIAACYPALIYYDTRILRESLTAFLVTVTAWTAINTKPHQTKKILGIGLLIGISSMCRPELLLLGAPILYFINKDRFQITHLVRKGIVLSIPILLLWGPWSLRNYVQFGDISPVAIGLKSTIWFGNRWAEIGGDDHAPEARKQLQSKNQAMSEGATEATWDEHYEKAVWQDLIGRPGWFIKMTAQKTILFWKNANGVMKTLPAIHPALPWIMNTYYYSLLVLVVLCLWAKHNKSDWVKPLFLMVLSYMMIYALLHVRNRYRVPILPIVFVLSAGGFWALYDLIKSWIHNRASLTH